MLPSNYLIEEDEDNSDPHMWHVAEIDETGGFSLGPVSVTFDKEHVLNLWSDFPEKFTDEQIEILRKEDPYWFKFFAHRLEEYERTRESKENS